MKSYPRNIINSQNDVVFSFYYLSLASRHWRTHVLHLLLHPRGRSAEFTKIKAKLKRAVQVSTTTRVLMIISSRTARRSRTEWIHERFACHIGPSFLVQRWLSCRMVSFARVRTRSVHLTFGRFNHQFEVGDTLFADGALHVFFADNVQRTRQACRTEGVFTRLQDGEARRTRCKADGTIGRRSGVLRKHDRGKWLGTRDSEGSFIWLGWSSGKLQYRCLRKGHEWRSGIRLRHALAISRLRTGGLRIKTMRVLMTFLIEPVVDRLLAGCVEMLFHTFRDAA